MQHPRQNELSLGGEKERGREGDWGRRKGGIPRPWKYSLFSPPSPGPIDRPTDHLGGSTPLFILFFLLPLPDEGGTESSSFTLVAVAISRRTRPPPDGSRGCIVHGEKLSLVRCGDFFRYVMHRFLRPRSASAASLAPLESQARASGAPSTQI